MHYDYMRKYMTARSIINKKRTVLPFTGSWLDTFGCPEVGGSWLVWGSSGSGKTTFIMQLMKYLCKFGTVLFNPLEEGNSESLKLALLRTDMQAVGNRLRILDRMPLPELKEMLREKRSPRVVVIDSLQYSQMTYAAYTTLGAEFPDKLFILVSHADGKLPDGKTAQRIRYDAFVKIRVEGYRAFAISRYRDGVGEPYTIWEEEAKKYHGE